MNIVQVFENDNGTVAALIADDAGNIVGINVYQPESEPLPELTEEQLGVFRRAWRRVTGG
jgi:hypothetical protein